MEVGLAVSRNQPLLDEYVECAYRKIEGSIDFIGPDLRSAEFARTRVSPIYRTASGLHGYLEVSKLSYDSGDARLNFIGIIEVPESVLFRLDEISSKAREAFTRDFKVATNCPDNVEIAPFEGYSLPEKKYYVSYHPQVRELPIEPEDRQSVYFEGHLILLGYLSKMQQWISHVDANGYGRTAIEYVGNAEVVGFKRDPEKLAQVHRLAIETKGAPIDLAQEVI